MSEIHIADVSLLAKAHANEVWNFARAGDWRKVTCGACKLERPAEKMREYRVPADVLARDIELGRADVATYRKARLEALLADTRDAEEYATRMIREFALLLSDATDLSARLTGLIEALSTSEPPAGGTEGVKASEALSEPLGGPLSLFHAFEVGAGGTGMACTAMIVLPDGTGDSCGQPVTAAVHAKVITWEDVPERYRTAPVNAVDIRTDAGYAEGMTQLSKAAETTLINANGSAKVTLPEGPLLRSLKADGYVGANGGLTRKGSIARERLLAARLDEAFGN